MKACSGKGESGFSLVEMMVALTVTMIVSGAIYGLLASGQTAFRREPELADRQQNIRVAMNLIEQDILNGGAGLPATVQAFTIQDPALPVLNGAGMQGSLGTTVAAARGGDNDNTDVLEILGTNDRCPAQTVCSAAPLAGAAGAFVTRESIPTCFAVPGLVLVTDNNEFRLQNVTASGFQACPGAPAGDATQNGRLTLGAAIGQWQTGALGPVVVSPANPVQFLYSAQLVRYRIAPSTDPLDTAPSLWRSGTGRFGTDGLVKTEPGAGGFNPVGSPWQLVARGIEDLQVEYRDGGGLWTNSPPVVAPANLATVVREVRVTLSARTTSGNLQGGTDPGTGSTAPRAFRGQLTRIVAPRGSLVALQVRGAYR